MRFDICPSSSFQSLHWLRQQDLGALRWPTYQKMPPVPLGLSRSRQCPWRCCDPSQYPVTPRGWASWSQGPAWECRDREPGAVAKGRMLPWGRTRLKGPGSVAAMRTMANPAWVLLGDWSHFPFLSLPGDLDNTWGGVCGGEGDLKEVTLDFLIMWAVGSPSINWEKKPWLSICLLRWLNGSPSYNQMLLKK